MKHRLSVIPILLLIALIALAAPLPGAAQEPGGAPIDPAELETFIDGVLATQLATYPIPGATVSIVQSGEILLSKGYGYADVDQRIPVDGETTIFRTGSISKLFTWTAIMQLVEAGKVDLHTDVNAYLTDVQIADTFEAPVTLWHLMTHTAGFEDKGIGTMAATPDELLPLETYLAQEMPARVYPPGEVAAYSNHGTSLAGLIIENVTGMAYEDYIAEHIFEPLGMTHSTFEQPLPPDLAPQMAKGYLYESGVYEAGDFEVYQTVPAGAQSSTATDMARFIITQLQDGRYGDVRILKAETAQQMQTRQFAHDPRVAGWTLGFMDIEPEGQHALWHGGDLIRFHAALLLLPEHETGLFVSYNAPMGTKARFELVQAFLTHYFPTDTEPAPAPPGDFEARAADFAGDYWPTRTNHSDIEKLKRLIEYVRVRPTGKGTLRTLGLSPGPTQWVEVAPNVFRNLTNRERLVFEENDQGQITHLYEGNNPTLAYVRLPWYATSTFQFGMIGGMLALFLSAVVGWPIAYVSHPRHAKERPLRARLARGSAGLLGALFIILLIGLGLTLSDYMQLATGLSRQFKILLTLPLVIAALALSTLIFAVLAWLKRDWNLGARIHYTLVTLASLTAVWWLAYWNLIF